MTDLRIESGFWHGRRVFLTGHTGFKGSWLATWLIMMGASVKGYALAPNTEPNLFSALGLANQLEHTIGDVRNREQLERELVEFGPDIVFHLAAQPLVRDSYTAPVETYATNVMGTVHVLDAIRRCTGVRAVINITTDKCYENREWVWGYREVDSLGGHDPYSSSKAGSELVTASWRRSFFPPSRYAEHGVAIASARAGNVIGGGDWSRDRLVPDAVRAFVSERTVEIRNAAAIRPWQHVLEPLSGYLMLAQRLYASPKFGDAWNFGPASEDEISVRELMDRFAADWGDGATWKEASDSRGPHEATRLLLDCTKASQLLGWRPRTTLSACLRATADWYKAHASGARPAALLAMTHRQIDWFVALR